MESKNYLKIVYLLAFIAFAGVSCWATAESLHLLLSQWPTAMCWVVTVGFFIIASFGTKMIVDSLNQNIYMDKRGSKLVMGVIIVLVFWLVCSMPTNTHTFFYRTVVNDVVNNDIQKSKNYLTQVKDNANNTEQANIKVQELKNKIDVLLGELESEIMNEANPGFGPKSEEIFRKFAKVLDVDKIEPLNAKASTKQERMKLCDAYRQKIYTIADSKARSIIASITSPSTENQKEASTMVKNLDIMKKAIDNGDIDLNNAEDMENPGGVCDKLNNAYNIIKKNDQFVNFKSEEDKAAFTAPSPVTKTKRLISVFDAWEGYFKGDFEGHGFVFWIIISILVDIAAFIFFDLAFKKTEE